MSELLFSEATEGVDRSGIERIQDDIKLYLVTEASEALLDTDEIINAIATAWSGPDAQNFLQNFQKEAKETVEALEHYNNEINRRLTELLGEWQQFQESHVNLQ